MYLRALFLCIFWLGSAFASLIKDGIKTAKMECELPPDERTGHVNIKNIIDPALITPQQIREKRLAIKEEAIKRGLKSEVAAIADDLKFIPATARKESSQPERMLSFTEYKTRVLTPEKLLNAKKFMIDHNDELEKVEQRYKVDKEAIIALILMETNLGKVMGTNNLLDSLFTLSLTSYRPQFWQSELLNILILINRGDTYFNRETKGSWAGASGMVQFIPSSFIRLAVDGDGDGRIDLIANYADIFASAANYLRQSRWQYGGQYLQQIPNILTEEELCKKAGMPDEKGGVIVVPDKKLDSPTFLVHNNFAVILTWNRSLFFATSIGIIYNELKNVSK